MKVTPNFVKLLFDVRFKKIIFLKPISWVQKTSNCIMKKLIIPALLVSLVANFAFADDKKKAATATKDAKAKVEAPAKVKGDAAKAEKKAKKPKPELKELTLTGKITKKETVGKNERKYQYFYLETSDGNKIRLTNKALGKKSKIKLDDFVNANVTVRGKGYEKELKNKKTQTYIQQITAVEK